MTDFIVPKKLDLLLKYRTIKGGDPYEVINDMSINEGDLLIEKNDNNNVMYEFTEHNSNYIFPNKKYYAKGGLTAIFTVKEVNTNKDEKDIHILRVSDDFNEKETNYFLERDHITNKKEFGSLIPDIYYYGSLYKPSPIDLELEKVGEYQIVRKYHDEDYIQRTLSINAKFELFKKLVDALITINDKGYVWRDLKMPNIGMDNNNNPIVLDYDPVTILSKEDKLLKGSLDWYATGTYPPYYILYDYVNNKESELDKFAIFGVLDILIKLFYNDIVPEVTLYYYYGKYYENGHGPQGYYQNKKEYAEHVSRKNIEDVFKEDYDKFKKYIREYLHEPKMSEYEDPLKKERNLYIILNDAMLGMINYKYNEVLTYTELKRMLDNYEPPEFIRSNEPESPLRPPKSSPSNPQIAMGGDYQSYLEYYRRAKTKYVKLK